MKATSLCFILAALLPASLCAQAMIEHAAAAAGATAGTIGGKALSNAIDKTLGKAAEVASKPAAAKSEKKVEAQTAPAAAPAVTGSSAPIPGISPLGGSGTKHAARSARASAAATPGKPVFATEQPAMIAPADAMAPPPPTAEDFEKIKDGESRSDVFAALGVPSSHVTIPDDGHLVEILSYYDGSRRIGTVRVDNGQVVSVTPASPK